MNSSTPMHVGAIRGPVLGTPSPSQRSCMYYACMVALQIRDVPDEVRDQLVERATMQGQSLQAYLLALVEADARRARNLDILRRFADRRDGSRLGRRQATSAVRAARGERGARAHGAPG